MINNGRKYRTYSPQMKAKAVMAVDDAMIRNPALSEWQAICMVSTVLGVSRTSLWHWMRGQHLGRRELPSSRRQSATAPILSDARNDDPFPRADGGRRGALYWIMLSLICFVIGFGVALLCTRWAILS